MKEQKYVGADASTVYAEPVTGIKLNRFMCVCPQKRNTQNGITLIALIITIIVLLILAMVSIKLIWDGGIIKHANQSVALYDESQSNELEQIKSIEKNINEVNGYKEPTNITELFDDGIIEMGTKIKFNNMNYELSEYKSQYDENALTSDGNKVVDYIKNGWAIMKQEDGHVYLVSVGFPYYHTFDTTRISEVNQFLNNQYKELEFVEEAREIKFDEFEVIRNVIKVGINAQFAVEYGEKDKIWFTAEGMNIGESSGKTYALRVVLKLKKDVRASQVVDENGEYYWQLSY